MHFQFNFDPYRKGGATPSDVLEIWQGEFDWMDANVDGGILTVTMHPQVIGRGHRMAMLERFVDHCERGRRPLRAHGRRRARSDRLAQGQEPLHPVLDRGLSVWGPTVPWFRPA